MAHLRLSLEPDINKLRLGLHVQRLHLPAHLADVLVAHPKQLPPWWLNWQRHLRNCIHHMSAEYTAFVSPHDSNAKPDCLVTVFERGWKGRDAAEAHLEAPGSHEDEAAGNSLAFEAHAQRCPQAAATDNALTLPAL